MLYIFTCIVLKPRVFEAMTHNVDALQVYHAVNLFWYVVIVVSAQV